MNKTKTQVKLCIVTPSFSGGGAERVAINLANEYASQGYDVTLLAFRDEGPYKQQIKENVRLHIIGLNRGYKIILYLIRHFRQAGFSHILSVLRGANIIVGLALWFKKDIKLVFREADELDDINLLPKAHRIKLLIKMRLAYFRANLIIANASKTKCDLISFNITNKNKIKVIHNPVLDNSYYNKINDSINFKFDREKFYFLNVGRLHYQKNQELLIKSFSHVLAKEPTARLIILGEGEEEKNLKEVIESLQLANKVYLLPFQNNPFPFYKHSDCFVLSSRWEGFGNVIVEALAAGIPVISTNCGGPRDILQNNKYGVLVKNENMECLVDAMLDIMKGNPSFSSDSLKRRGNEFTVNNKSKEYLDAIMSI